MRKVITILNAILIWNCLATPWANSMEACLTGLMTDLQSWVDQEGRLIDNVKDNASVDVSESTNPVSALQHQMRTANQKRPEPVRILSLARCKLREVPEIFSLGDSRDLSLADTIEYLTLYGNKFDDHKNTGNRYDVYFNATNARTLTRGMGYDTRAATSWPGGLVGVQFKKLKELDLRACAITTLGGGTFRGMENLEALYLSENNILYIDAKAFAGLRNLTHLDLSRNYHYDEFGNHKNLVLGSVDVMDDLENLVSLDFSYTALTQSNLIMFNSFGKKFQRLSLCETGLTKLRNSFFSKTSIRYLDLSGNNGILNYFNALGGLESTLEVLYAAKTGFTNFDMFERFKRLEILNLQMNEINVLRPEVTRTLQKLQVLNLDRNRIGTWFDPTFSVMPNLKYLSLRNNNINIINEGMIEEFKHIQYIGISGNFVICNCYTRELFELALQAERNENRNESILSTVYKTDGGKYSNFHIGFNQYNEIVSNRRNVSKSCDDDSYCDGEIYGNATNATFLLVDYDPSMYQCMQMEGKQVSYSKVLNCNMVKRDIDYDEVVKEGWNKLIVLIVIPAIVFPILGFVFVFRKNFRYFCITVRNSALLSMINKNTVIDDSRIFNYDVFVSYCNDDRSWILDQLLPHLETNFGVSVCLHERDFQVGLSILENIVSCMDRSRTIMLIISQQFLLSQWCQFEMHLAQHRLLETRREDLILVLLEEIPRRLRPTTLHYLMLTKTYIVYPVDSGESARKDFWKRLGRSVAARRPDNENDSLA